MLSEAVLDKIRQLPLQPGVYLWKNEQDELFTSGKLWPYGIACVRICDRMHVVRRKWRQ